MNKEDSFTQKFKKYVCWLVVIGTAIFTAIYLAILVYRNFDIIVRKHFAATVGLPLGAIGAFCIVYIFEYSTGVIEFEGLGFKFKGASGPIILWLLCFLGIVMGIKLLW